MKTFSRYLLIFLSLCNFIAEANNDYTQNIKGQITDKQSGVPIPGVMVRLLINDSSEVVMSDFDGYYKVVDVPVGRISLMFSYMAYNDQLKTNLVLTSGKEYILNIQMEETVTEIDAVAIKYEKNELEANNKNVVVSNVKLNPDQTQKFAGTFQDVSRMAANYAGVVPAGDQRNDIIVRGNSPMGIIWRLEGINIPNPNHFGSLGTTGGPISILNNNNLASSDFLTGAFPSEYGNGTAGAFDLKMRTGNNEKFEFTGQMGFNGLELGLEGPFKKESRASYMVNYRYSTLGIFDAIGVSFGVPAVPQYQDVAFKVDLPTSKYGRFQLFGIGGLSHINLLDSEKEEGDWTYTTSGTDVRFKSNMGVVGLNHKAFLSEKTYWSNTVSIAAAENIVTSDTLADITFEPFNNYNNNSLHKTYSLNSTINTKINSKSTWRSGAIVDVHHLQFNEQIFRVDESKWEPILKINGAIGLLQAFTQYRYKFNERLVSNVGLHYQTLTFNGTQIVEPRAGVKYEINKKHAISFAGGLHSQMQPLRVYLLQTNLSNGENVQSNKNLDFTKSIHSVLGYTFQASSNFRIKLETYYQHIYDTPVQDGSFFSLANTGADFINVDVDSLINNGTGKNYGIELTFEKTFSKGYYFLVNASLYDSKYIGGDGIERNTAFNGSYTMNSLAGYEIKFSKKATLTLDVKFVLAGGKRYQRLDINASKAAKGPVYDEGSIFELKYDDYMRFDAKIGFRLNGKRITQEWAFDVQNVTNKRNVFREVFDPGSGEIKYEYQMGLFPVGLYKITF